MRGREGRAIEARLPGCHIYFPLRNHSLHACAPDTPSFFIKEKIPISRRGSRAPPPPPQVQRQELDGFRVAPRFLPGMGNLHVRFH